MGQELIVNHVWDVERRFIEAQRHLGEQVQYLQGLGVHLSPNEKSKKTYISNTRRLQGRLFALDQEGKYSNIEILRQILWEGAKSRETVRNRIASMIYVMLKYKKFIINKISLNMKYNLYIAHTLLRALDFTDGYLDIFLWRRSEIFVNFPINSKRKKISSNSDRKSRLLELPDDWRERLLRYLIASSNRYWKPIAIQIIIGCRPEEIKNAVNIEVLEWSKIRFSISNAKAGIGKKRYVDVLMGDPYFQTAALLAASHATIDLCGGTTQGLAKAVRAAGQKLGFRSEIAPGVIREAFGCDLYLSRVPVEGIALALGYTDPAALSGKDSYIRARHGHGNRRLQICG